MTRDNAHADIRRILDRIKALLAQEGPPQLSEADTKAEFLEPIIVALGWAGIGVVKREYYVKESQEFIDYVMSDRDRRLLAIEAKPLQTALTEKHAAQLIQYCAVEGIEWAALTNSRELQFFNTFLKPDLAAKRLLRLDLLAFNTDAEYDALFAQVWQLSRESMTSPTGVHTWLHQRRLDEALRAMLVNPVSPVLLSLRRKLNEAEIRASPQELAQWFRTHLAHPITILPVAGPAANATPQTPHEEPGATTDRASPDKQRNIQPTGDHPRQKRYFGVTLAQLLDAGLVPVDTPLILLARGQRAVAQATLGATGEIVCQGRSIRSLSNETFKQLLGVTSFDGWKYWHADLPEGRVRLDIIRDRYLEQQATVGSIRSAGQQGSPPRSEDSQTAVRQTGSQR